MFLFDDVIMLFRRKDSSNCYDMVPSSYLYNHLCQVGFLGKLGAQEPITRDTQFTYA